MRWIEHCAGVTPYDVETDLREILQTAERLTENEDWRGAGMVYAALLDGMTESYPDELQEMDEEGEIACIAQDCAEGLKKCLEAGIIDQETRLDWLTTLLGCGTGATSTWVVSILFLRLRAPSSNMPMSRIGMCLRTPYGA